MWFGRTIIISRRDRNPTYNINLYSPVLWIGLTVYSLSCSRKGTSEIYGYYLLFLPVLTKKKFVMIVINYSV